MFKAFIFNKRSKWRWFTNERSFISFGAFRGGPNRVKASKTNYKGKLWWLWLLWFFVSSQMTPRLHCISETTKVRFQKQNIIMTLGAVWKSSLQNYLIKRFISCWREIANLRLSITHFNAKLLYGSKYYEPGPCEDIFVYISIHSTFYHPIWGCQGEKGLWGRCRTCNLSIEYNLQIDIDAASAQLD